MGWRILDKIYLYPPTHVKTQNTFFFRFANKRAIYRLGIISLAHTPVHVTDFLVVNVPVDELSSAQIGQHILCATFSASVNINNTIKMFIFLLSSLHI
jgi:hypothetical protein